ncbi:HEAT repeat-containing protein 2 [Phytophthora pseudosyringae]|uniref:HEAT repeat-containing protein 2 n=1 Tax=Phytophthora pseudosyringae TaxID=221518 RepID=A0A8T1WNV5_9STRA|nr:HEAT repeat-containing protein 2 [Phytophthora pseudosyringae]
MALSPEDESAFNMLAMKMQRDVNCLSDPDRSVRRRAADKLNRALQNEAPRVSAAVLRALCVSSLQRPLLQCAESDAVEKCRERALTSLLFLCERGALEPSDTTLKELVALANARLGKLPYLEPTEEIRLLILQLLHGFLKQFAAVQDTPTSLRDVISELANALGKTAVDPFPDAKKMSAECVILVSKRWKSDVGMQIGTIVRPMVVNLGHQHSRVRVCALQALEAAVPCGSEALPELMKEVLLPAVSKVVFDHAPSVRKQLVITLAAWLGQIDQIQQFVTTIFPVFLAGIVDESPEVRALSLAKLNELSTTWETREEDGGVMSGDVELMEVTVDPAQSAPPLFFETRPPLGARKLAANIQAQVLPPLLEKTGDWTVQVRERYTQVLSAYLILLEQNMNPFLDKVFAALGKICRDDEEVVYNSVKACSGVVGFYADSQMILASLLPLVAGRLAGQDTAQHRTNGLILLGMSIEGMTGKTIGAHLELITEALCDAGLRESEVADLQDQLAGVISSIVKTAGPVLAQKDEICFRLFWVLSHLLAASSETSVAYETASESMEELAAKMEQPVEALYAHYMGKLLVTLTLPTDATSIWQKNDPSRVLFDSLCRRGGVACGENLDKILPVFLAHLEPAQDADVRLAFLALLETMLGTDAISQAFKPFSVSLLQKAIIPNIVWRGGRVAATIRKVAVACAYTLLRQGIADQPCLFETAPQVMLPVLKSSMDDSDAKTRQLVCLALQYLFVALPGCLGEEPVHQLYAEILKRLDDSNDTVRKAACQTFTTFLKAAPKEHFRGTIIDYTLDCLFVHLDDSEPDIQEAVFEVLKETVAVDAPRLAKKAEENRTRHQSPRYCDQLLALATAQST